MTDIFKTGCFVLLLKIGLFIFGVFFLSRFDFYINSAEVEGQVTKITSDNDSCYSGRRHSNFYDCTEYTAVINYTTPQGKYTVNIWAGSARGHNQSISLANYQIGEKVEILYDTRNPTSAYRNTFLDIWNDLLIAMLTLCFFILRFFNDIKEWYIQVIQKVNIIWIFICQLTLKSVRGQGSL